MSVAALLHLSLHGLLPGAVAWLCFRPRWTRAWLIMLATMAVDLDHLLATPIYDPGRCSIGFHPLHQAPAIAAYGVMTLWAPTRVVGTGLLLHMGLDASDCVVQRLAMVDPAADERRKETSTIISATPSARRGG